jgi:hypothetical protein
VKCPEVAGLITLIRMAVKKYVALWQGVIYDSPGYQ